MGSWKGIAPNSLETFVRFSSINRRFFYSLVIIVPVNVEYSVRREAGTFACRGVSRSAFYRSVGCARPAEGEAFPGPSRIGLGWTLQ